jgi:hypothetical protein
MEDPPWETGPSRSFSKARAKETVPVRGKPAPMTRSGRERSVGMEGC